MSGGHDTTYYHDFATTTGPFAEFMNWIETIVGQGQWSLAGHSGAGDVIAKLLNSTHRQLRNLMRLNC